jgi:hypothetical protein
MCRWHLSFFSFLPSSSFSVHYFAFATLLYIAARRIRKTSPKRQDKSSFSSAAVRTEERMSDTIRVPNLYGGSTIHLPVLSVWPGESRLVVSRWYSSPGSDRPPMYSTIQRQKKEILQLIAPHPSSSLPIFWSLKKIITRIFFFSSLSLTLNRSFRLLFGSFFLCIQTEINRYCKSFRRWIPFKIDSSYCKILLNI